MAEGGTGTPGAAGGLGVSTEEPGGTVEADEVTGGIAGVETGGVPGGGVATAGFWTGLGGKLIIAVSRGLDARGLPSRRGGRTIRTVSFLGSGIWGIG